MLRSSLQTALRVLYPSRCLSCGVQTGHDFALCSSCWREVEFITGLVCDECGVPLPGRSGTVEKCDGCLRDPKPWQCGRAAVRYEGQGRDLVLKLKHGDRDDIAEPAARWMLDAARDIIVPDMIVAPVPLHWKRILRRRYNQSHLLGQSFAQAAGLECVPDLLVRRRHTPMLEGKSPQERKLIVKDAITVHAKIQALIKGRAVLLVDDVMTTGATLGAATRACYDGGAKSVNIVVLARVC